MPAQSIAEVERLARKFLRDLAREADAKSQARTVLEPAARTRLIERLTPDIAHCITNGVSPSKIIEGLREFGLTISESTIYRRLRELKEHARG